MISTVNYKSVTETLLLSFETKNLLAMIVAGRFFSPPFHFSIYCQSLSNIHQQKPLSLHPSKFYHYNLRNMRLDILMLAVIPEFLLSV